MMKMTMAMMVVEMVDNVTMGMVMAVKMAMVMTMVVEMVMTMVGWWRWVMMYGWGPKQQNQTLAAHCLLPFKHC